MSEKQQRIDAAREYIRNTSERIDKELLRLDFFRTTMLPALEEGAKLNQQLLDGINTLWEEVDFQLTCIESEVRRQTCGLN